MMMRKHIIIFGIAAVFIIACNNSGDKAEKSTATLDSSAETRSDSDEACVNPQKYPNQDKPMALMMRQMADNAQAMKNKIMAGEKINAQQFPFIRFHLVEPTDPDVLQPQFYENARLFQESHKAMVNAPQAEQKAMYTLYINQCINCHQTYCSGPLKRIRKLQLD